MTGAGEDLLHSPSPGWMPNNAQLLLLQACLAPAEQARDALGQWADIPVDQRRDNGSLRLLPLLWSRREATGIPASLGSESPHWKQEVMRTWSNNQRLLACANKLAESLERADIPVILIKGLPLALQAYGDLGARPMGDLDIAVPHRQARQAVEALVGHGWKPLPTPLKGGTSQGHQAQDLAWTRSQRRLEDFSPLYFHVRHSHGFRHGDGLEVDLHWSIFQGQCDPDSDNQLWEAIQPLAALIRVPQARPSRLLQAPDPAEHLLLLLAHGARWDVCPPIRWIADAVMLLRSTPDMDWSRFLNRARCRSLTLVGAELLTFLKKRFAVDIPESVLEQLRATQPSRKERRIYQRDCSPADWRSGIEELRYLHRRYRLLSRRADLRGSMAMPSWPTFLCHILGAPRPRDLGRYALQELKRRRTPA